MSIRIAFVVVLAACGGSQVAHVPPPSAEGGAREPLPPPIHDALDACRQHTLTVLNDYRAKASVAPLVLDDALSAFAQEGSLWEKRDQVAHGHMKEKGRATFRGTYRHENQGPLEGIEIDPNNLVDSCNARVSAVTDRFMEKGPGEGHHDAVLDPRHHKLGVGLLVEGSLMWMTTDFVE